MPDGKIDATLQNHGATSIKAVAVPDLIPNDRNAKNHNAEQVAQIAASISEFGFNNLVYCDVIVRRWQTYTGRRAHREDGSAFDAN